MHVVESDGCEVDELVESGVVLACGSVYVVDDESGLPWYGSAFVLRNDSNGGNNCTFKALFRNKLAAAPLGAYDEWLEEGAWERFASSDRSPKGFD